MSKDKFSVGDKVFYVDKESDSEVECYIYRNLGDDTYMVKLREGPKFGFFPGYRLTWIDPEEWESLEENLHNLGLEMDKEEDGSTAENGK